MKKPHESSPVLSPSTLALDKKSLTSSHSANALRTLPPPASRHRRGGSADRSGLAVTFDLDLSPHTTNSPTPAQSSGAAPRPIIAGHSSHPPPHPPYHSISASAAPLFLAPLPILRSFPTPPHSPQQSPTNSAHSPTLGPLDPYALAALTPEQRRALRDQRVAALALQAQKL